MIDVMFEAASPQWASLVQGYESRQAALGSLDVRMPLAARTDLVLDFYLRPSTTLEDCRTGQRQRPPSAVIVAPQTRHQSDVLLTGEVAVFSVKLQPTALHDVFGLPMPELTNGSLALADLLGTAATADLFSQLAEQRQLGARVQVLERFLQGRIAVPAAAPQHDPIAHAVQALRRSAGSARMDDLAAQAGLSARHFSRLFNERVGMSPKVYARVLRLHAAVSTKVSSQTGTWADVAQAVGYFDQAHLNKDFRELAGATPTDFLRRIGIVSREEAASQLG